jgi:hypothetical protein
MFKPVLVALAVAGIVGYACGALFGGDEIIYPPPAYTHTATVTGPTVVKHATKTSFPPACALALRLANAMYGDVQQVDVPYKELPSLLNQIQLAEVYHDINGLKDAQTRWNNLRNQMIPGLEGLSGHHYGFRKVMDQCISSTTS